MKERDIENHLVDRAVQLGGEVRKVKWIGRRGAPDRLVMLPAVNVGVRTHMGTTRMHEVRPAHTLWVELKAPGKKATFPADAHERQQDREHKRMRAMGQRVEVIDSIIGVEELLK
jgi:hypothetical protein